MVESPGRVDIVSAFWIINRTGLGPWGLACMCHDVSPTRPASGLPRRLTVKGQKGKIISDHIWERGVLLIVCYLAQVWASF